MVLEHGLDEAFRDISPIEAFAGQLRLDLKFTRVTRIFRPPPKFMVEEC